jgi:hypothetical protein
VKKNNMIIQFGTETEIGIAREKEENLDVVAESMALVRSATKSGVLMRWDYNCEDPHADMRGFHVEELRQDTDEASYFAQDAERELTFVEIKSDLVLGNGARYYNDHAHPEYCTPECSTVEELVAHDRAGERILMRCAQKLSEERDCAVCLYKNNTDFRGHSYGCHENYLLPRSLPWEKLARGIQAFLVTRQIVAGAGKFAIEEEDKFVAPGFQISQRSDFFSELQSVDTMQRRPIVNTRDEPHANPNLFRRFHVILGDANMSPFATRLKIGTTALVLEALARDPKRSYPSWPIRCGVDVHFARRKISLGSGVAGQENLQRPGFAARILAGGQGIVRFERPGQGHHRGRLGQSAGRLGTDPMRCRNRLDWAAKLALIREFQARKTSAPTIPGCKAWTWNITGWTARRVFITRWNNPARCWACRMTRSCAAPFPSRPGPRAPTSAGAASRSFPPRSSPRNGTTSPCKARAAR